MSAGAVGEPGYVRNQILRSLDARALQVFLPSMEMVSLDLKLILQHANQPIDHVYFVETGTVSMIAALSDGSQAEVGLVGREGMVGLPVVLGSLLANLDALVQVTGSARRLATKPFLDALETVPTLRDKLLRYVNTFHLQVAQTAVCNSRHPIEKRLARWILMTADRAEDDQFPMTQEFMSRMLGVQRPGVNVASRRLQNAGFIRHERAWLRVLDRPGLEAASCECYSLVQDHFKTLARINNEN